ncbi:MAG: C-terminal binding protein [Planctomycetaceae bacterium]|nr:C-terminal binding protein [Planctomycetaceae bacterium]
MFKVAITDFTFSSLEIEENIIEAAGGQVVSGQCKTPELLIPLVSDVDAVITQFAPVNADVVRSMERARVIVRYGVGYDNVACDVARERKIPVCNIPDYCVDEVADHTLAFILAMTRHLRANCAKLLKNEWGLGVEVDQMRALCDQTVGVIGLGRIGSAVVERLKPFRPKILVADPFVSAEAAAAQGGVLMTPEELLAESDVVTLHCPSTDTTRGLINEQNLRSMKAGSILINVGRGDLVEQGALVSALKSGHLGAAALDVFDPEPLCADSPLRQMNNVIISSHVASVSTKAIYRLRETAARLAVAAVRNEPLANIVNQVSQ